MATYTNYYSLKKPADNETADIADLNNNADTIDSTIYNLEQSLLLKMAAEYNSSNTYATGSIVLHDGKIYYTSYSNVTGDWDSSKWTETSLGDVLTSTNSYIGSQVNSLNNSIGILSGQVGTNYGTMMTQDWRLLGSIAENYSTSNPYVIGDYVMYEFNLYRCIADTTGDWDDTAWARTTIIDIIKGL